MSSKPKLTEDEIRALKKSWKLADKLTLASFIATSPITKSFIKMIFKTSFSVGAIYFVFKTWSNANQTQQMLAGRYLADVEEKNLIELQQNDY